VVVKPEENLTGKDLTDFLRARLAKFKIPHRFEIRSEPLPKTGTGKILKRELREVFWQGKDRRIQG
jgi:acyl-CoA synthetase (AMP-forming)/AMP-acid ligase II